MGSSTKVIPTTTNTQQSVQIPDYLQQAGKDAIAKADSIADTPFQAYTGEQVAPLTTNQNTGIATAAGSGGVGQGSLGVAQGALGAATGAAVGGIGAGQDSLGLARGALDAGAATAANGAGAGQGALMDASNLFNMQSGQAAGSVGAGRPSSDLSAALASIGAGQAVGSMGAGGADLAQARTFNNASAGPITSDMISQYMNPYVQQAIDPVVAQLNKAAGINKANLDSKAAMSGSFGGARTGLEEAQNQSDLINSISGVTGTGYLNAFNNAQAQAQAQLAREQAAAGTSINIGAGANTQANDTLSRLTQAGAANNASATTASDLATAAGNRLSTAGQNQVALGNAQSNLTTEDLNRILSLVNPANATATTASNLSTDDVNRLLSLVQPANATATESSQLTNDYLNRLLTTGAVEQGQQQNVDNAAYQQFQNMVNYPQVQLNALLAAAGGQPYGTTSTSNTQGTQVVQSASPLGQIAGLAIGAAGAFSNRDWKTDFAPVEDEDILKKFRNLGVESYRYKPELGIDDGRVRIGPMAQDFAKEFGGDGKIIPMPTLLGSLVSAVRALEARTSDDDAGALAA